MLQLSSRTSLRGFLGSWELILGFSQKVHPFFSLRISSETFLVILPGILRWCPSGIYHGMFSEVLSRLSRGFAPGSFSRNFPQKSFRDFFLSPCWHFSNGSSRICLRDLPGFPFVDYHKFPTRIFS